jgi:hypothetical protein
MTQIEKIIEDLTSTAKTLTDPLLKTKVLASRIGNDHLSKWVDDELKGYPGDDGNLPSYRMGRTNYTCSYIRAGDLYTSVMSSIL